MAVYVDPLTQYYIRPGSRWRYGRSCHLVADTDEELRAFATALLGMKGTWYQPGPSFGHFDLTARRRDDAIRLGAIPLTRREMGAWMLRKKGWERGPDGKWRKGAATAC